MAFTDDPTDNIKYNVTRVERETRYQKDHPATLALKRVGRNLTPDGNELIGSVALHFYIHKLSPISTHVIQITEFDKIPENVAQHALRELQNRIMKMYGHKMPRKRFEDWSDNASEHKLK